MKNKNQGKKDEILGTSVVFGCSFDMESGGPSNAYTEFNISSLCYAIEAVTTKGHVASHSG